MKRDYFGSGVQYSYPKKVKHVAFITAVDLTSLENQVNAFADDHSEYKILGIKLITVDHIECTEYIATVTYLCNAKDDISVNPPYYDERDPEYDED